MKRFLLFTIKDYGAEGGWDDFDNHFDSASNARSAALAAWTKHVNNHPHELGALTWHVVDLEKEEIVLIGQQTYDPKPENL